ncbi:MAG TPA: universal stress protein [Ktedonobacteraceae bacterium]
MFTLRRILKLERKMSKLWFQRILVPLDGSTAAEKAIPVAERIARASGGKIELLAVSNIPANPSNLQDVFAIKLKMETEKEQIDRLIRALQQDSIPVERVEKLPGTTDEQILETAAWAAADIIVLCVHKYTEPEDSLLKDVAQEIERRSSQPLLLLHEENPTQLTAKQRLRALVTLDPNETSPPVGTFLVPAMRLVATLNAPDQGTLHLFGVLREEQALDEARIRFKDLANSLNSGAEVLPTVQFTSSVVTSRDVAEAIVKAAQSGEGTGMPEGFDLIAMATHGRAGLQHVFRGSVTEHVLGATQLPIFIVHHP